VAARLSPFARLLLTTNPQRPTPRSLSLLDAGALALCADYAQEGRARHVADFDDHLDDLSRRARSYDSRHGDG